MNFNTPGVYVQEISTFPPSVVPVETAIPAFIGNTERATDVGGSDLALVPTRITSFLAYQEIFGGGFRPTTYRVQVNTGSGNAIGTVSSRDASGTARRYYLYDSIRHFYANGGGPCYIVSTGSYDDDPQLGTDTSGLLGGLVTLGSLDEPTLLLFPDGVQLSAGDLGSLQVRALQQCERLKDRFMVTDVRQGDLPGSVPIDEFRDNVGTENLKYGAAYYPWLQTIYRPDVGFRHLVLVDLLDTPLSNTTLDSLTGELAIDALVPPARAASLDADAVVDPINASMGSALALDRYNFGALSEHFDTLLTELRVTPNTAVAPIRAAFGDLAELPRAIVLNLATLDAAVGLSPTLSAEIANLRADTDLIAAIEALIALEKNTDFMNAIATARTDTNVNADYASLDATDWITVADTSLILADGTDFGLNTPAAELHLTALSAAAALQEPFDLLAAAILSIHETAEFLATEAERPLFEQHPVYAGVVDAVNRSMSVLPASGGVAGVYAAVDRKRGVWKAPANLSLADVSGPAVKLNDEDQSSLNVHSTGKSINVLRSFAGKGTLVWGARTLAGNDNEWRYVPVRRFFNMAEESIKKATEPFVFEPNDANTWVRVRAMIENFLTIQWRQGALAGAVPAQAFYVKIGLGETMTSQDILEGRLIIEVGMAVVRPAEFIILKFAHKMQT